MLLRHGMNLIVKMNIFNSHSTNEHIQKNERLSTKIYFILLITCLAAFGVYTSTEKQSKTMSVNNPTQIQFEQLQNQSVNNLQCPCSKISIKYSEFISFDPTYHQICSSVFTSSTLWYNAYEIWVSYVPCPVTTFPNLASFYFSLLSTFCQSSNETVSNSLTQFYAADYVTSEVVVENQFNNEVISFIEVFKTRTQQSFKGQLDMIRNILFVNQIISAKETNVEFYPTYVGDGIGIYAYLMEYDNCSCGTDPTCHEKMGFCHNDEWFYVAGIYAGCYMVDSLLISTTECFFDETCINLIKKYVVRTTELYEQLYVLNNSETSQYKTNETIETIVENLFIENWNEFYSYKNYYNQCNPSVCSYTSQQRLNYIDILTKLIGIYGGLAIVIGFLVPKIVNTIEQKKIQRAGNYLGRS
jgi:hypothetical protein